jgi:hypothetical protein
MISAFAVRLRLDACSDALDCLAAQQLRALVRVVAAA